jgi:PleD family two-component response regulator
MINHTAKTARARIAWLAPGGSPPDPTVLAAAADARLAFVEQPRPIDVAVVDLRNASEPASLLIAARRLAAPAGFLILASPDCDAPTRAYFRRSSETIFAGAEPAPLITAIADRLRLAALADETGERIKSRIAAGLSVGFPKLDPASPDFAILVAGRPSPLTLQAVSAVKPRSAEVACVFTAGQAMRAFEHQRFDGAVFLPSDENDLLIPLARALRRHREHRRLPVLLTTLDPSLALQLSRRDGFETIAPRHIDNDLAARLEQAARRTRVASAMRVFLKSAEAGADPRTGAVSARFFAQHVARIFDRANETGQPVVLLGVWRHLDLRPGEQDTGDAQMLEIARITRRLVRAEDLVGRLSSSLLAIAMRAATGEIGARVAERLEGIISGSISRAAGVKSIVAMAVEREAETSLETCLARLIRLQRDKVAAPKAAP